MMTTNDVARVMDTIMTIPGMNETVKVDLKISRKNVLLLKQVIERGLNAKGDEKEAGLLETVPEENLQALRSMADECLQKAGLTELNDKLNGLNAK